MFISSNSHLITSLAIAFLSSVVHTSNGQQHSAELSSSTTARSPSLQVVSTTPATPEALTSLPPLSREDRARLIEGCTQAANYSKSLLGHAVLVLRGGEVIFERYDNGWQLELPHGLASGTKSFVGVVAAAAVEDGLMSWDEPACETLIEWKAHPQKSKITPRQLLNLSSGLDPSDDLLSLPLRSKAPNLFIAAVHVPSKYDAGAKFEYGPSHFYAFGEFLQRKINARKLSDPSFKPENFTSYMYSRVLDPIGMKVGRWGADREGNLNLPGGARLTAREWAKFGEFIRLRGHILVDGNLKPLISWNTLSECFKPSPKNPGYGLTWWLISKSGDVSSATVADEGGGEGISQSRRRLASAVRESLTVRAPDGTAVEIFMAAGKGKQRMYIIPSYGLTVVRFAEDGRQGASFQNQPFLEPILGSLAHVGKKATVKTGSP